VLLIAARPVYAQEEGQLPPDSTAKTEAKADTLPVAGWDPDSKNSFFVQDPSGNFRLNLGAYSQPRFTLNKNHNGADGSTETETGWSINRTRIFFQGHATEALNYALVLNVGLDGQVEVQQSYVSYLVNIDYFHGKLLHIKGWSLDVGRQFLAASREDWQDPADLLAMECSAVIITFGLGNSLGVQFHHLVSTRFRWWAALSNGAYGARVQFGDEQATSNILFSGRLDWQLVGEDWRVWNDLIGRRDRPFGVMIGVAPSFMVKGTGTSVPVGESSGQVNVDLSVNGEGFQALTSLVITGRNPATDSSGVSGDSFTNIGFLVQGGYFVSNHFQVFARYQLVSPGSQPGDLEVFSAPGFGINYLPFKWTNRMKFTVEVDHLFGAINNTLVAPSPELGWVPSDARGQTLFRIQFQYGF
jgi:hypothetical protein